MDRDKLEQLVRQGETENIEFKKSSAQLRRAMETLCGMLNGAGGRVLIGITPQGKIIGQEVSDKTLREVADHRSSWVHLASGDHAADGQPTSLCDTT